MIGFGTNRNSPIPCSLMADLELTPWASDTPAMQVPEDLLRQSIQRATIDFALRREQEFQLFKTSKVTQKNIFFKLSLQLNCCAQQTREPILNRLWASLQLSTGPTPLPSSCPTLRFCWNTHPKSSSTTLNSNITFLSM